MELTLPPGTPNPRIVMFGIDCHFTNLALLSMLSRGLTIAAVVLPGPPRASTPLPVRTLIAGLPLAETNQSGGGVLSTAEYHHIPVYRFGRLTSPDALVVLESFDAELLISACYPRIIPAGLTRRYPGGALNVHPSLLPALRGPDPLFWTFREGSGETGVTIHELAPEYDAGPILAQERHVYPDGTSESELEAFLADRSGMMTALIVERRASGIPVPRTEQDHSAATYAPFPSKDDYHLDHTMTARAAFNFARGIEARGVPLTVDYDGQRLTISRVFRYEDGARPLQLESSHTAIPFRDGFLIAEVIQTQT